MFDRQSDAAAFRAHLFAAMAEGRLAFAEPQGPAPAVVALDDPDFARIAARHTGAALAGRRRSGGLIAALKAVSEAVLRCEGEGCCDPGQNPALARAAARARLAGADDATVADAIAAPFDAEERVDRAPQAQLIVVASAQAEAVADLAWRAGGGGDAVVRHGPGPWNWSIPISC